MNKNIFIVKIITSVIFIGIVLFSLFHQTGWIQIALLPFLICGIASAGKNICFLINKNSCADLFKKLYIISFFLFAFGFLIFWSYSVMKTKEYLSLLFTIPFWLLGIYMLRKSLFPPKKTAKTKKEIKYNFKVIISALLVLVCFLCGVVMLFFGIRNTYQLNQSTKGYLLTEAYFEDYEIYSADDDGTMYTLLYTYEVNGKEYHVKTDYAVGSVPSENSIRKVKYDPNNPENAVLAGTNSANSLIYMGLFFVLGSTAFILGALYIKGAFEKIKIDVMGLYFGFLFFIVGIGILLFQNGTAASFWEALKSLGIWAAIPILFIVAGGFQIIKCLFFKRLSENRNKRG